MGECALIENPRMGAFAALRKSRRLMRGNCISLLQLDLSFWWFYVLEVLLTVVCYADMLLPMVGIQLPFSSTVAFFLFYLLNLGGQVALYWWKKNSRTRSGEMNKNSGVVRHRYFNIYKLVMVIRKILCYDKYRLILRRQPA